MAGFYAAYHGAEGLKKIATRILKYRQTLQKALRWCGIDVDESEGFDTVRFKSFLALEGFNVRYEDGYTLITIDECTTLEELKQLVDSQVDLVNKFDTINHVIDTIGDYSWSGVPLRKKSWLTQEVFNSYHSETDMMRYIYQLVSKDFSLVNGMMPLGSCTMKLNAAELMPVSWSEFSNIHPFAPASQTMGYDIIINDLKGWLCEITGFDSVSLQPNAGSQGEYAGLLAIQEYHKSRGEASRNVCLIPESAHGTNPASAVMAGMKIVSIKCDDNGNIDLKDSRETCNHEYV